MSAHVVYQFLLHGVITLPDKTSYDRTAKTVDNIYYNELWIYNKMVQKLGSTHIQFLFFLKYHFFQFNISVFVFAFRKFISFLASG